MQPTRTPGSGQTQGRENYGGIIAGSRPGRSLDVSCSAGTKLIHSAQVTAANVPDNNMLPALLHGEETEVFGDQAYQGRAEVIRKCAPRALDRTNRGWRTKLHVCPEVREQNRIKSRIRTTC